MHDSQIEEAMKKITNLEVKLLGTIADQKKKNINSDEKMVLMEKMISFDVEENRPELINNKTIVHMKQMMEDMVTPTMKRCIELQDRYGDLAELQLRIDIKVAEIQEFVDEALGQGKATLKK